MVFDQLVGYSTQEWHLNLDHSEPVVHVPAPNPPTPPNPHNTISCNTCHLSNAGQAQGPSLYLLLQ